MTRATRLRLRTDARTLAPPPLSELHHSETHRGTTRRVHTHTASVTGAVPTTAPSWAVRDETITLHKVHLESGDVLESVKVRFRLEGTITPARDNVVVVVHALTGTPEPLDWWRGVVEPNGAIDPTRHAVLAANLLGGCSGTSGPHNNNPDAVPPFTTRDQAMVLGKLLDALGVATPLLVCGGSLGGQVTLEFAASFPSRIRAAVVLAAPAAQTAQGLAWNCIMRRAIAVGGHHDGLVLARMIGMLSYRTPAGLERRFGRAKSAADTFQVNDWLETHGEKLVARFDATSYVALLDAMDAHDVGRGRGGIGTALAPVASRITAVGIPGDLLYPAEIVREWANAAGANYIDLPSQHGHDAFLLEATRVSAILRSAIERSTNTGSAIQRSAISKTPVRKNAIRVALAGCGHVGSGVLELLSECDKTSNSVHISRVLVRDVARTRPALTEAIARGIASADACTSNAADFLTADIDVLVEAIGGVTIAHTLVEAALRRGIRVVTANKALLAARGPYLQQLAQTHGTRIDFEGAVAGAIPVVRCIRHGATGVGVFKFSGILNGTSNFVLDRITDGASLPEAIAEAQQLGYAEADPTRDLSGEDAEDKLRVLAWLAFGADPASLNVVRHGIDDATAVWAKQVAAEGDRVKLIASCTREHGELVSRIAPTRVRRDDAWAAVSGPNNRIVIESTSAGALVFHGAGAGGRATAGAVLSDVLVHIDWGRAD